MRVRNRRKVKRDRPFRSRNHFIKQNRKCKPPRMKNCLFTTIYTEKKRKKCIKKDKYVNSQGKVRIQKKHEFMLKMNEKNCAHPKDGAVGKNTTGIYTEDVQKVRKNKPKAEVPASLPNDSCGNSVKTEKRAKSHQNRTVSTWCLVGQSASGCVSCPFR